ncbi:MULTISPECIES: BREX-2 system phosphatase PglZ [unclassified Actinopolyspora]|uniref:BREX-2 system phosphatase PglZ n=1 Tax=unclassified Actinopolyspora TaxID=2639451 RepID=UPI0013F5DB74|nr:MULTISPECIES: BREX-2 system phosphatase PglZ [unclassified Actinopolyspora]NHD18836.1 BREX-2 system phosphatase PglZ [Actinopolyspora sp. BKK2]NHE77259.1 BREX-2 system phosphatase PglZ [Actinopolyspora sp. BKK1]
MTLAGNELFEQATLARLKRLLNKQTSESAVYGIQVPGEPSWSGAAEQTHQGVDVRFVCCESVLAIHMALADWQDQTGQDQTGQDQPGQDQQRRRALVLITNRTDSELGPGVLARLENAKLYSISHKALLETALGTQTDKAIFRPENSWLTRMLTELYAAGRMNARTGGGFTLEQAHNQALSARLGLARDELDAHSLLRTLLRPGVRQDWADMDAEQRRGLVEVIARAVGEPAKAMLTLAERGKDPLTELLVVDALLRAERTEPEHAKAILGAYQYSRELLGSEEITKEHLREAADKAVELVKSTPAGENEQWAEQRNRADKLLSEFAAETLAVHSDVLPSGFGQRLERLARELDTRSLEHAQQHHDSEHGEQRTRLLRVRNALRLRKWLASNPDTTVDSVGDGLRAHANELAWVDRAINHVITGGDPSPAVAATLRETAAEAQRVRREIDLAFGKRLAAGMDAPPGSIVPVEDFARRVLQPLGKTDERRVLLIVLDGMSGAVAAELAEEIIKKRRDTLREVVRDETGQREALLAAFPTTTRYSRSSLFAGRLVEGDRHDERNNFRRLWNHRKPEVFHKNQATTQDGGELDSELVAAIHGNGDEDDTRNDTVAVVLNTIDEALTDGRESNGGSWTLDDIPMLNALLRHAESDQRTVVLVSDHGHVPHHETELRSANNADARWRSGGEAEHPDEIVLRGKRMLAGDEAVFATTEAIRYGKRAAGYHGGAALAEVAIPLLVLHPVSAELPKGWYERPHDEQPQWWHEQNRADPRASSTRQSPETAERSEKTSRSTQQDTRARQNQPQDPQIPFDELEPSTTDTLGEQLVRTQAFQAAHKQGTRAPRHDVFAAVIDALVESPGQRLAVAKVAQAAGQANRNPRGLVSMLTKVLNRDGYAVLRLTEHNQTVELDEALLREQFLF